ncbi:iron permease FTR1 [Chiua virens]|nr:iron permease FTR1 [Chiua virens]
MSSSVFSVSIFFVVFREALESALIISVLLSLVNQIFHQDTPNNTNKDTDASLTRTTTGTHDPESNPIPIASRVRVLRKLKLQVLLGALAGLGLAIAIGAAFIAIWFTQAKNLWSTTEQVWEGVFQMIASIMIFLMAVGMLKMEYARAKWRIKLQKAFEAHENNREAKTGKWVLFVLPFLTILREGLEAVVFVGGVSLAEPATSIPLAAIVGIILGLICGVIIYQFASRTTFRIFLVIMTNLLFLIGAGLFSRAVWAFQKNNFMHLVGNFSDDTAGTGPGSYDVRGNVWHLDCCSSGQGGWSVFNSLLGWQNSATLGSVLSYVFYWLAVIVVLVHYKFKEGRTKIFGYESAMGKQRRQRREAQALESPAEKD